MQESSHYSKSKAASKSSNTSTPTNTQKPKSSSKKTSKTATPVLLALPDGELEEADDTDVYTTKLGGKPIWLQPDQPPSSSICRCDICHEWMYLVFQGYVPLPKSAFHRVLYLWICNRRSCMRKPGSFKVLRSHLVDPQYLKAQRKKEEEKRKQEAKKLEQQQKAANMFGAGQGFQLGDLWGADKGFSSSKPFGTPTFGAPKKQDIKETSTAEPTLAERLSQLHLQDTPSTTSAVPATVPTIDDPVDASLLPKFDAQYLYIAEENLNQYENLGMDVQKYKKYLDMEAELLEMDQLASEGGEVWVGEAYEKQQLPRGVDKQFKRFMERIECEPSQCARYDWGGAPLLYHQQDIAAGKCKSCGGRRTFEFQLMPNVLSLLPTAEYAARNTNEPTPAQNKKALLDSWNVGMEFGTVLVFVCERDCHPGDIEQVSYVEEAAFVQYEMD
ncbi:programmed cell death protein 2 [Radiomyces spectabilis]|uniref:programmed cell death protein 2 n=1 Tax=Radiomyces spectabilis TaxID=64574 RepID=UPI00221F739A|nr:programmed cell death protein 2 [Radiomyces spectabilis]KAI8394192.1 programmed cell death protein 2 [Radiomyces spectabilis]